MWNNYRGRVLKSKLKANMDILSISNHNTEFSQYLFSNNAGGMKLIYCSTVVNFLNIEHFILNINITLFQVNMSNS